METLNKFYKRCLQGAFGGVALLGILIGPLVKSDLTRFSFVIGGVLFLLAELIIRKWLWKVFYGNMVIAGTWEAKTTYEEVTIPTELKDTTEVLELPYTSPHKARFKQDCLNLVIETAEGKDYPRFYSLAIEMAKDETATKIRYAYYVNPTSAPLRAILSKIGLPGE